MLDTAHDFPLPPRMVEAEFAGIWSQVEADRERGELAPEDEGKSEDELRAEYRKIAERRVRLGLVLAEIGRRAECQRHRPGAGRGDMRRGDALRRPGAGDVRLAARNPDAQAQMRAPIYEEKVVDCVFGLAKVEDKSVSKDELQADEDLPL